MIKTVSGGRYALPPGFLPTSTASGEQGWPTLTSLGANGFLASWSAGFGGTRMQLFDLNGNKIGPEIVGRGGQGVATPDGGFVLTWSVESPYPSVFDVKAQRFDSAGNPVGDAVIVNTRTDGFQTDSRIALLANGNLLIAWDQPEDQTWDHVRYQLLSPTLQKIGPESIATDSRPGDTDFEEVIALADGGFVIAWHAWNAEVVDQWGNLSPGPRAQIFNADGSKRGDAFSLHTILVGTQYSPELAALPGGGFVAAWSDDGNANSG
jgi:hypothetical protein